MTDGRVQRNRAADGNAGQRHRAADAESVEERREIVGHGVDGKRTAHLLRQAGAARVIAQHATPGGQRG
jgi:hypothetical protein